MIETMLPHMCLQEERYFRELVCKRDHTRWLLILKVGGAEGPQVVFASAGTLPKAVYALRDKLKDLPRNLKSDKFALGNLVENE